MAEPTVYEVSYSFSGWQATNPAQPLPAIPLDNELAGIEASIASVAAALADIRRADGSLENDIVTLDSLEPSLRAAIGAGDDGVTVLDLDPSVFASQNAAEQGSANNTVMTPLRTKQALDAQRAFAGQAEAETGVEDDVVMSPLRTKQAIDGAIGAFSAAGLLTVDAALTVETDDTNAAPVRVHSPGALAYYRIKASGTTTFHGAEFGVTADDASIRTGGSERVLIRHSDGITRCKLGVTVDTGAGYAVNDVQVLEARKTGWGAATGTATRTTFATGSVTTAQLAERVKALIDDLIAHGLIGT